jgi:pyrimidine operon attenuation protein / uracil phosphoribosyltransferase
MARQHCTLSSIKSACNCGLTNLADLMHNASFYKRKFQHSENEDDLFVIKLFYVESMKIKMTWQTSKEQYMETPDGQNTTLYGAVELGRVLDAMSASLVAKLLGVQQVSLVGVRRRGAPLADMLHARLRQHLPKIDMDRIDLSIKRYSDDLKLLHPETLLTEQPEHAQIDLSGRVVVLVDDVLYRGFSMSKAIQYLLTKGVDTILTTVLVDRVCTTLPMRADVAGLRLEVAPSNIVECHVPPFEPLFQIVLVQPSRT